MNKNKDLENLLKQYHTNFETANRDLTGWPRATREGQEMAKRTAQNNLPHVRQKYSETLNANTNYILVYGSDAEFANFLNQLEDLGSKFFYNSTLSLYEYLCPRVEQNLSTNREFNVHSLMMLQGEMVTLGKLLDKNYILEPKLDVVKVPKTHEDLVMVIRETIMANSHYSLLLDYLNMVYTDAALNSNQEESPVTFVLRCINESEANDLGSNNSKIINLSETDNYKNILINMLEIPPPANTDVNVDETVKQTKIKKIRTIKPKEQ